VSTTAFHQLERDTIADEQDREDRRVERLSGAGKLCAYCFATDGIERETNLGVACWHCTHCGERWIA
jgi:hypothetical protein